MAFAAGARVGPYEILSLLGRGGMGEVYRAHDARLGRDVAIKLLLERDAADPDSRLRFEREARAAAALSHPHICPIFDVGQHEQVPFIVMEYLEGETLADRLGRGKLPLDVALDYAGQIVDALVDAHRQGVVHRDLKPSNVMLVRSGVKLVDFGVAKRRHDLNDPSSSTSTTLPDTRQGTLVGTLQYMAPEQLEGGDVDAGADVFAFGAVLYEMVTGSPAFASDSKAGVIAAVLDREPRAPGQVAPATPPELETLIVECLVKERLYRPASESIARRIHGMRDLGRGKLPAAHGRTRAKPIRSVAVMPFKSSLVTESEDAFSDGMAEGLVTSLASFPALRVISRTSTRRYTDSPRPLSEVARELRVDGVLTGDVHEKEPGLLSVNAELADGATEDRIWSGQYVCERADILNVQEQIAQSVAAKIRLSGALKERISRKRTVNRLSHEAYLKGRFHFDNRFGNWVDTSFDAFTAAIRHDRTFAPAHVALSRWYVLAALRGSQADPGPESADGWRETWRKAEEEARHALKLDPNLAEAHSALGQVLCYRRRFDEAELAFRKSLALGPSVAFTHASYSEFLSITDRADKAVEHAGIAKEHDPFATYVFERLACALYAAQRFAECMAACSEGLELTPNAGLLYYLRGQAEGLIGNLDAAIASLTVACEKLANHASARSALAAMLFRAGQVAVATEILNALKEEAKDLVSVAEVYVAMAKPQDALDALEAAFERESPKIIDVGTDPAFLALRGHPRFKRLLHGIGLAPYISTGGLAQE